jgi:uroporphyrinogen decarboxylase
MNSRQLVQKTLAFDNPPRAPRDLWTLPWAEVRYPEELQNIRQTFEMDFFSSPGFLSKPLRTQGDPYGLGTYVDEWGAVFTSKQAGVIGEVKEPVIKTWEDARHIRPPEEALSVNVDCVNAVCEATDKFVMSGCCPRPFERLQFLRGSENLFLDLGEERSEVFELLHKVHQFYLKEMEIWASTKIDAMTMMDDWGAQQALLISPKMWRKVFKPLYKDYIDLAHAHGKYAFMHSDGFTADIIPDLIELGLDVFNTQLFCMDIERLGVQFKGKITFWGEIDRQHLLPEATPAEIAVSVERVYQALYAQGGAIAQCEFGAGARPENVYAVYDTWEKLTSR